MNTIRTLSQAHKVVDHLNGRMNSNGTVTLAGFTITKIEDREFVVSGEGVNPSNNKFVGCELAEFVIWPNRKAWNAEIKAANSN